MRKLHRIKYVVSVLILLQTIWLCNAQKIEPVISKGPYLQAPGSNTMTILWEAPIEYKCVVHYGINSLENTLKVNKPKKVQGNLSSSTVSGALATITGSSKTNFYLYEVTLTGLKPDTVYNYSLEIDGVKLPPKKFKTFSVRPEKVTFIAYGDTRTRPDIHAKIARWFKGYSPEFILHTGDLVSRGSRYTVWSREFFGPLTNVIDEIPLFPILGNHEEKSELYFNYFKLPFKENYYDFVDGPVHIVCLDYHYSKQTDEQFKFAKNALESSKSPWKIVVVHNPLFNVGGHTTGWGHKYYLPLFHQTKVDVVIAGHSHIYERFFPLAPRSMPNAQPITHITSGGGGAPLHKSKPHPALAAHSPTNHFLVFEATSNSLKGICVRIDGAIIDSFELVKSNGFYTADYLKKTLPVEPIRLSLEAATNLVARVPAIPPYGQPIPVLLKMVPLPSIDKPAKMKISLSDESKNYYAMESDPVVVTTPAPNGSDKNVWIKVKPLPTTRVRQLSNGELAPPLYFVAEVEAENDKALAIGSFARLSDTAKREFKNYQPDATGQ